MSKRYPGLSTVSSLYRLFAVIIGAGGFIASLYFGLKVFPDQWSSLVAIVGVVLSLFLAIGIFAIGDFYQCVMDIEENTRTMVVPSDASANRVNSIADKQRQISQLQSEIADALNNRSM